MTAATRPWDALVEADRAVLPALPFKIAWNNKNLFGGYNGTGGIAEDIAKQSHCQFDEKLVVVFFGFFGRRVFKDDLGEF